MSEIDDETIPGPRSDARGGDVRGRLRQQFERFEQLCPCVHRSPGTAHAHRRRRRVADRCIHRAGQDLRGPEPRLEGRHQLRRHRQPRRAGRGRPEGRRVRRSEPDLSRGAAVQEAARTDAELRHQHPGDRGAGLQSGRNHARTRSSCRSSPSSSSATRRCRSAPTPIKVLGNLGIQESQLNIVEQGARRHQRARARSQRAQPTPGFVYITDALSAGSAGQAGHVPGGRRRPRRSIRSACSPRAPIQRRRRSGSIW